MRSRDLPGPGWTAARWGRRLAQVAPKPDRDPAADRSAQSGPPPGSTGDAGAADGAAEEPSRQADSPDPGAPAEALSTQATPTLSDDELAKLSEQEAKNELITVTGSLIERREVDSPSPVSVVDREKLASAGITNVGNILQNIPAQGNALNAQNNANGDGSTRVNLRSLGPARTLVLLNGRRVVASGTGADSSVDLGTIPLAMIERVEVLKDGASAIYGSDAIAGVVNIITRTNFSGTEASIHTATSSRRDGTSYDLSFVTGHSSTRGNITFSGGYQRQDPVMAGERGFSRLQYGYDFTCSAADAKAGTCHQRSATGSPASASGRLNTQVENFTLSVPGCTTQYCTADGRGGFRPYVDPGESSLGDNYNFQPMNYLYTPSSRVNLFSNGHYDITDNAHVFFEGQFNTQRSSQQAAEVPLFVDDQTPISKDSMYNPLGRDVVDYARRLTEFGPRTFRQDTNTARLVAGLRGTIDETAPVLKNWRWEGSYNYGRSESTQTNHGNLILSHVRNALGPSFMDPQNGPQCGTTGHVIAGCVPLSVLTPGEVTQAMIDYLTFSGTQSGFNEQHTTQLTASGRLVDLPGHGDVSLAVGADYRFERGGVQPDPLTATGDTTGSASAPTQGSYNVFEGFAELSVVPYSGGDVIKWAEVNAAGRAYRYNTFGSGATAKVSGLIRSALGLALRGTYGNAFRAPNIAELFAGQSDDFPNVADPCDTTDGALDDKAQARCAQQGVPAGSKFGTSQQRAKIGGNPMLQPEKGRIGTLGAVYEPLAGLAFTVDYWHVKIDHAIDTIPVETLLSQCYQGGLDRFCGLVTRNAVTHRIDTIVDTIQNIGARTTSGIDFGAAYQYRNALGTFRHALEGTYLLRYNLDTGTVDPATGKEQIIHGKGFYDLGVNPDLKLNAFTTWSHPAGASGGFNIRFVDSFQECDSNNCNLATNARRSVEKYTTGDVFIGYAMKGRQGTTSVTVGMNNVNDARPPVIYNAPGLNADATAYDFMGRQFYVRLSQLF